MKPIFEDIQLVKNVDRKRFEIAIDGSYAFINYGEFGNQIALVHTETEPELAGKGAATAVIEKTLHYLEEHKIKLLPFCPFVFAYIKRNPEWKRIVSKKFKGYDQF
ncbi:N-acetyltransferase [Flavobacterium alkalisoli]|uniref:N-acetyltransferase n=1 Tax=Flavobacterium alkalisoli TaxID=2602769 RepID=A0A5B9FSI7_9FLAO|nr:GNAT family N-acetyltransferase [Flavobacterium alkalisoli]QEE50273.1 N-acetyltransferase [Flavobacterium alkalisoli]